MLTIIARSILITSLLLPIKPLASEQKLDIARIQHDIERAGAKWKAGETEVTRMSPEQRTQLMCESPDLSVVRLTGAGSTIMADPPTEYSCADWMTPIGNVGYQCAGAVCAFAINGAYEARYNRLLDLTGQAMTDPDLSEQAYISCYALDCGGCNPYDFLSYLLSSGVPDESCYPYDGTNPPPACDPCVDVADHTYEISARSQVSPSGEDAMMIEIYDNGPIVVMFDVFQDFISYSGGVYQNVSGTRLGSNVAVVYGWDSDGGTPYWLCKFHWGTGWGEVGPDGNRGWFRILKGVNEADFEHYMWHMTPVLRLVETCCIGEQRGDVNLSSSGSPDLPTIGDISAMIDAKFISSTCGPKPGETEDIIACIDEADVNASATGETTCDDITIGDISLLVDYLFITGPTAWDASKGAEFNGNFPTGEGKLRPCP